MAFLKISWNAICSLDEKCNISLSSLSDSEILEKAKDTKILDNEFNKILDWITELIKARPTNYQKAEDVLNTVHDSKNELKMLKTKYQKDLNQEIKNHDLSPKKIKNASVLRINIPKYHGYGSSLDFYTFKSEFEKLISPYIREKLLPEYLKHKFLGGQAFEIVKGIDQIEEIWERLKTSFGNVVILLNDTLSEVVINGPP